MKKRNSFRLLSPFCPKIRIRKNNGNASLDLNTNEWMVRGLKTVVFLCRPSRHHHRRQMKNCFAMIYVKGFDLSITLLFFRPKHPLCSCGHSIGTLQSPSFRLLLLLRLCCAFTNAIINSCCHIVNYGITVWVTKGVRKVSLVSHFNSYLTSLGMNPICDIGVNPRDGMLSLTLLQECL